MRTISKQPISPGKLNLDELLQLLEEKDEILKQMVERVKNQENQILMLLKEGENGLAKQVSRVPYSVYREFVEEN